MYLQMITRATFVTLIAGALLGCDSDQSRTAVVRGKLTYKGQPVPSGTINFIPASGPAATGEIQADGTYTLTTYKAGDGAVTGKHAVVVVAMQDMSNRLPEDRSPMPAPIVPIKYTSIATSDLRAVVEDKENTINFDLTDEKPM